MKKAVPILLIIALTVSTIVLASHVRRLLAERNACREVLVETVVAQATPSPTPVDDWCGAKGHRH